MTMTTHHLRKILSGHICTVARNKPTKFEVSSFYHFGAVTIQQVRLILTADASHVANGNFSWICRSSSYASVAWTGWRRKMPVLLFRADALVCRGSESKQLGGK